MNKSDKKTIKLIYNPNAGKKRAVAHPGKGVTIEEIEFLLNKYLLPVDLSPTKGPGDATKLAKEAIKQGYEIVLAAGGDGTINETANGLVGSDVTLGIIPLGSFMNIAHMLALPTDVEQATQMIKIGRTVKIDVGEVTTLEGDKLSKPYVFLETSGVGIDAHMQQHFRHIENGKFTSLFPLFKEMIRYPTYQVKIATDDEVIECPANLVTVANGPVTGAALRMAPDAKLNDHNLTVVVYHMSRWNMFNYFRTLALDKKVDRRKIRTFVTKKVKIESHLQALVHADATMYGKTPVSYKILPAALNVICGFPDSAKRAAFKTKTFINP